MPLTRKTATPWNSVRHFRFSCFSSATNVYQHKHHHLPTLRTYGGWGGHVYVGFMLRWNGTINIISSSTHPHTSTLTYASTSPHSNMRTYGGGGACLRWVHVALERQHQHIKEWQQNRVDTWYDACGCKVLPSHGWSKGLSKSSQKVWLEAWGSEPCWWPINYDFSCWKSRPVSPPHGSLWAESPLIHAWNPNWLLVLYNMFTSWTPRVSHFGIWHLIYIYIYIYKLLNK